MLAVPSKATPFIFLAVASFVALEALPLNVAVIVPAEKLPEPSLLTRVLAVFVVAGGLFPVCKIVYLVEDPTDQPPQNRSFVAPSKPKYPA